MAVVLESTYTLAESLFASGADITIQPPTGLAEGDLWTITFYARTAIYENEFEVPAGFDAEANRIDYVTNFSACMAYQKIAGASEGNVVFKQTTGSAPYISAVSQRWSGIDADSPIQGVTTATYSTAASVTLPSVSGVAADSAIISVMTAFASAGRTFTFDAKMTKITQGLYGGFASEIPADIADSATGTRTHTINASSDGCALMFVINPAGVVVDEEAYISQVSMHIPAIVAAEDAPDQNYIQELAKSYGVSPLGPAHNQPGMFMSGNYLIGFYAQKDSDGSSNPRIVSRMIQIKHGGNPYPEETVVALHGDGFRFAVCQYRDTFHFVYEDGGDLKYQLGTMDSGGAPEINWLTAVDVYTDVAWSVGDTMLNIITDQNGYPIVSFRVIDGDKIQRLIAVSTTKAGTWTTDPAYPQVLQVDKAGVEDTWHCGGSSMKLLSDNTVYAMWTDITQGWKAGPPIIPSEGRTVGRTLNLLTNGLGDTEIASSAYHWQRSSKISMADGTAMSCINQSVFYRDSDGTWYDRSPSGVNWSEYSGLMRHEHRVRYVWFESGVIYYRQTSDNGVYWESTKVLVSATGIVATVPSQIQNAQSTLRGENANYYTLMFYTGSNPHTIYYGLDDIGTVTVPTLLTPNDSSEDVAHKDVTFEWDTHGETGTSEFELTPASDPEFTDPYRLTWPDSVVVIPNFEPSTTYLWRVRIFDGTAWSDWSEVSTFTTKPPLPVPQLTSPANNSINVSANPVLAWDATGYDAWRVQVYSSIVPLVSVVDTVVNTNEYGLSDLDYDKDYYWRVAGIEDITGEESEFSTVWSFKTIQSPVELHTPANTATGVGINTVLTWIGGVDGARYNVQVSRNSEMTQLVLNITDHPFKSYNVYDLLYETTYYWRVQEIVAGVTRDWIAAWSFVTEEQDETNTIDLHIRQIST